MLAPRTIPWLQWFTEERNNPAEKPRNRKKRKVQARKLSKVGRTPHWAIRLEMKTNIIPTIPRLNNIQPKTECCCTAIGVPKVAMSKHKKRPNVISRLLVNEVELPLVSSVKIRERSNLGKNRVWKST